MVMIGRYPGFQAIGIQQTTGFARVFGQDFVGARQNIECAQGDIPEVPNGSRNNVQAGLKGVLRLYPQLTRVGLGDSPAGRRRIM